MASQRADFQNCMFTFTLSKKWSKKKMSFIGVYWQARHTYCYKTSVKWNLDNMWPLKIVFGFLGEDFNIFLTQICHNKHLITVKSINKQTKKIPHKLSADPLLQEQLSLTGQALPVAEIIHNVLDALSNLFCEAPKKFWAGRELCLTIKLDFFFSFEQWKSPNGVQRASAWIMNSTARTWLSWPLAVSAPVAQYGCLWSFVN